MKTRGDRARIIFGCHLICLVLLDPITAGEIVFTKQTEGGTIEIALKMEKTPTQAYNLATGKLQSAIDEVEIFTAVLKKGADKEGTLVWRHTGKYSVEPDEGKHKFHDAIVFENRLMILYSCAKKTYLESVRIDTPSDPLQVLVFDQEPLIKLREPLLYIRRAQIIPVKEGAFLFFVSKQGAHEFWQVIGDHPQRIWIKTQDLIEDPPPEVLEWRKRREGSPKKE